MSFADPRFTARLLLLLALVLPRPWFPARAEIAAGAVQELIDSAPSAAENALLQQIYSDNPAIARARAQAAALAERGPQAGTLPDPTLGLAAFLLPPETRTGPQRISATLGQRIPWKGKLSLREDVQRALAASARARVDEIALQKITQARRLLTRIAFIDVSKRIVTEDLNTLEEFEHLARSRYATGRGPAQSPIKLQAEITRDRTRLLELDRQRAALVTEVNALRDRPGSEELPPLRLAHPHEKLPSPEQLRALAVARHPAVLAGRETINSTEHRVALARKDYRPDFSVGMTYTVVDRRQDWAG
ncbi:MAG: TolC family protein [Acidobacteriota bacterium]|nr:TolC family protein [Acidobacteriota bacterium]